MREPADGRRAICEKTTRVPVDEKDAKLTAVTTQAPPNGADSGVYANCLGLRHVWPPELSIRWTVYLI